MNAPRLKLFLTVGSQMAFARLVDAVEQWSLAPAVQARVDVFGQVGRAERPPRNFPSAVTLDADEYERRVAVADLVVAHAGTGTIFTALRHGTPLLVLARRAGLMETRNDHQDATALRFEARGLLEYARDEADLARRLDAWLARGAPRPAERAPALATHAGGPLVARLQAFLREALDLAPAASSAATSDGEVRTR